MNFTDDHLLDPEPFPTPTTYCKNLYQEEYHIYQSYLPVNSSLFQAMIMACMLLRQVVIRYKAVSEGNKEAAHQLILGVYRNIFLYVFAMTAFAAFSTGPNDDSSLSPTKLLGISKNPLIALNWGLHHFGYEGITILLLHPGVGKRALKTSIIIATLWGIVTFFAVLFVTNAGYQMDAIMLQCTSGKKDSVAIFISAAYSGLLMIFYGLLIFLPGSWFFRRPALKQYCIYWFAYESITMFDVIITGNTSNDDDDFAFCIEQFNKMIVFGVLAPFVLLRTLRQDSLFWQGLYSPEDFSLNSPLMTGFPILRQDSIETIASNLADDYKTVDQIPYGMVSFDTPTHIQSSLVAAGASSRVYKGHLRQSKGKKEIIAIKMLFCVEMSATVINQFGMEIRLLNSLSHPNVVKCKGICIMPPALCLVTEFCAHGSLYDFLQKPISKKLKWNKKLSMVVDAVQGVEYLHHRGIVHGDIKSLNFLVTEQLQVKLSDLGEHRVIGDEVNMDRPLPKLRNWSAPEILSGNYGVPFDDDVTKKLDIEDFIKFVNNEGNRPSCEGGSTPPIFNEVLRHCFYTDPKKRCSSGDLLTGIIDCFETSDKIVSFIEDIEDDDREAVGEFSNDLLLGADMDEEEDEE